MVQETWLIAVRRVRDFDADQGSFVNWLSGIAANVLRNSLRRRQRQQRHSQTLNGSADRAAHTPAESDQEERAEHIAQVLAGLPEHYERVLRAKYLDQHSVAEIAAAWTETPKAVESMLTRARQAFREAYQSLE